MSDFKGEPPSYESVIGNKPDTIGEQTNTTPAHQNIYPQVPSAPPSQPYFPMPNQQPQQNYGSISEVVQNEPATNQPVSDVTTIVNVNGCPICRIGVLEDDYSCLGICLAIFCFPIGIICCLACKNKRCSSCGAVI